MSDYTAYMEGIGSTADVVLSARGTSRDGALIEYIREKLLPFRGNGIREAAIGSVTAKGAGEWELLQLADVCATTTFLAYEENGYGFCTPCFMTALSDHLFKSNGKTDSYGLKFFVNDMKPDEKALARKTICAKKERTPGATAT